MRSVNLGRWSRRVERYFNMKGGGGLMDVEQAIRLILQIASGNEDRYLEGWNRFGFSIGVTGGAAQFGAVQLRNPVGSNAVLVVEKLTLSTSAVANIGIGSGAHVSDLTTIQGPGARMDTRGNPSPVGILSSTTNNANPTAEQVLIGMSNTNASLDVIVTPNQEWPLLPGDAVQVFSTTAAITHITSLIWRERSLEQSELT